MSRKLWFATLMVICVLLLASCSPKPATPTPEANMPNPASVFCEEKGGKVDIRTAADGSQSGFCVFPDGSECDEWAFFRGECKPGTAMTTPSAGMPNPASVFCEEKGGKVDIRTAADGSQSGFCVFSDGSECDEWAFFRGECKPGTATTTPSAGMPNPASVFCEENNGQIVVRTAADGSQSGVCTFDDGSECDEWAYLRSECRPGEATAAAATPIAVATTPAAGDDWKTYQHDQLGYRFQYPGDATIQTADDPLKTLVISGPLADGEHWPQILISHPTNREEYLPPEGTDLEKWLIDHNLLMAGGGQPAGEVRQADTQIAGTKAIHTRHARSPQSYAYDKYMFAQSGQLYVVVLNHVGDREDWAVYERFLASIQFEK